MRWSSHIAKGWVPAAPIASPLSRAVSHTRARRSRSWRPASTVSRQGVVAISSTDSISSGLTSPVSSSLGEASSIASIMLVSSRVSASRIISSSSMPIVKLGPVNRCSMAAQAYPAPQPR